jgi:choline kinase
MKISAIILLAGNGKRIINLTKNPKCLLKINNQTIIDRNLNYLKELNIKNVTLVLGYKKNLIKKEIAKHSKYFNFKLVYNNDYKKYGNSYSLYKGLKFSEMKSLIFDGDLVYSKKILENFLKSRYKSSFLIGKTSIKNIECAKTLVDKNGYVKKTIDKRLIKKSELKKYKFVGEAIGIIKISNKIRLLMVKELEVFLKKKINLTLNWEHFMNIFLNKNLIKFNNTINSEWIEIDTKQDYVRAVSMFKK